MPNHERPGFGFGFELARVTRLGTFVAAMQQFVRLCFNAHKRIYVLQLVMSDRTSFSSARTGITARELRGWTDRRVRPRVPQPPRLPPRGSPQVVSTGWLRVARLPDRRQTARHKT